MYYFVMFHKYTEQYVLFWVIPKPKSVGFPSPQSINVIGGLYSSRWHRVHRSSSAVPCLLLLISVLVVVPAAADHLVLDSHGVLKGEFPAKKRIR